MRVSGARSARLLPLLAAALVGTLAACGSGGGTPSQATPSSTLDSLAPADLAAAAAKDGTLTWYTTFADDDVQPIVAAFNKTYPNVNQFWTYDAEEFLKLVGKHRITHTQLVPTMFVRFLKLPDEVRHKYDVS